MDMDTKKILNVAIPIIAVILIFSLVFFIRTEAVHISGVPDQMKSYYQDDNGLPYFSEMDSYYNYRMTADLLQHGYVGDAKINGTQWDLHSFFPPGKDASDFTPMISWVTIFFYKVANLFGHYPLQLVSFWTGAIVGSLAIIPVYFFIRRLTNNYGAIAAAVVMGLSTYYFSHTFAGFFDTDMFYVIFPILTVWLFGESILAKQEKRKIVFGVLSAVTMLLFSLSWEGWWYMFYLIIATTIVYMVVSKFLFNGETFKSWSKYTNKLQWLREQPVLLPLIIFVVLSTVLMAIYWGNNFISQLMGPFSAVSLQSSTTATAYPNVYVSVGELQIPTADQVVSNVGGYIPLIFGILGLLMIYFGLRAKKTDGKEKHKALTKDDTPRKGKKSRRRKARRRKNAQKRQEEEEKAPELVVNKNSILGPGKRGNNLFYALLFTLWLLITAYSFTKGVRFVEIFAIPIALCAGIFVGLLSDYLKPHIKKPSYHMIVMVVVLIVVCIMPVSTATGVANSIVPGTDDGMVNSLNWIKGNTPTNTVITSWWDYGHLFTAKADRPVTFDGSTQNNGRAYWVAKALYTSNENLSAGILRMLSSSGDDGYLAVENYTNNTGKSVDILDNILPVDKATAQNILISQYGMNAQQAQNILQYTHPNTPNPDALITSIDMVSKASWWSYFGNWDFSANNSTQYGYFLSSANATGDNNTVNIQSDNVTVQINATNATGYMMYGNRKMEPYRLMIVNDGNKTFDQVISNESTFSLLVVKQDNNLITVAMTKGLEDSMFTRLFFEQGAGLTKFSLGHKEPSEGISEVMVWNVNTGD